MPTLSRKTTDAVLLLILALLPLLFFWRLITPNPADRMNITGGDFAEQYFPLRAFAAREWVAGRVPLWNPYLYGGQPALADIQSGALYPPHMLQALLLGWGGPLLGQEIGFPLKALEWQAIFHFSVAAVGMFLLARYLLRRTGLSRRAARWGAVVASLVFTYSGYLTGFPVQQLTILATSAWLPWILAGLGVAVTAAASRTGPLWRQRRLPGAGGGTALAVALAILAGPPQTMLYIFYLSLAYAVLMASLAQPPSPNMGGRAATWLRPLAQAGLVWLWVFLLGAAVAAAQLLPTLEFIRYSVRAELDYGAVSAGLPLAELVSLLYPGFFGGSPEYVGIAALVLLALGLVLGLAGPRPEVSRHLLFWLGAALVSLLLAFGGNLFVYPLFYLLVPGFDAVRQQERAFLIFSFSAALLAGWGAALALSAMPRPVRLVFASFRQRLGQVGLAAVAVTGLFIYGATAATIRGDEVNLFYGVLWHHLLGLLILAGMLVLLQLRALRRLQRWWGLLLLAAWVAFNLFTVNWRFNLASPAEVPQFTPDSTVAFLQAQVGPGSSLVGRIASGGRLPGGNSAAAVYQLEDLTGNTPLHLARVERFLAEMPAWRLWQLMNVRYVVDERDIGDPGLRPVHQAGDLRIYEMGDPFERAWLVSTVEVRPDEAQILPRLAADDFDLRTSAVVTAPLPEALDPLTGPWSAAVKKISPTQVVVGTSASGRHMLVVSQIFYPGWQVFVDGQAAPLLRVNDVLQGVVLSGGSHEVSFEYRPASFYGGLAVSLLALLGCGALLVRAAVG